MPATLPCPSAAVRVLRRTGRGPTPSSRSPPSTDREGEPRGDVGGAGAGARIAGGYAFDGPALELGAVVARRHRRTPTARVRMPLSMLNRHGLVAGATGTGKTKTLQLMAEQLSAAGVPVFLADIKGDVSGHGGARRGERPGHARAPRTPATDWQPTALPGRVPRPRRPRRRACRCARPMTSFGPMLLAKVLGLNETQESSLGLVFHFADKAGLPLLDLKDLRAVIQHLDQRRGQGRPEGARRAVEGDRRA